MSNQLKMFVTLTSHFTLPVFYFPGTVKVRPTDLCRSSTQPQSASKRNGTPNIQANTHHENNREVGVHMHSTTDSYNQSSSTLTLRGRMHSTTDSYNQSSSTLTPRGHKLHPGGNRITYPIFEKPGRRPDFDYPQMAKEAVLKALDDAKLHHTDVQQACVGYVYGRT
uniref:Uncharacterized protein n=1 Tax=Timema cristinae TaxID=61476 RepID=A0A7R9HAH1_TIMCR|nr:unnamed protein product [Timema cristinae]